MGCGAWAAGYGIMDVGCGIWNISYIGISRLPYPASHKMEGITHEYGVEVEAEVMKMEPKQRLPSPLAGPGGAEAERGRK